MTLASPAPGRRPPVVGGRIGGAQSDKPEPRSDPDCTPCIATATPSDAPLASGGEPAAGERGSAPGMVLGVEAVEALAGDVGVDLGGRDVPVSEEELDDPQVRAMVEEVGGESVA